MLLCCSQARTQLRSVLTEAGLVHHTGFADRNQTKWPIVKACLAAGLYPNLVSASDIQYIRTRVSPMCTKHNSRCKLSLEVYP